MSKCHVRELMRVFDCILRDVNYAYPALRGEFEKDRSRLVSMVEARGIHALVVDLPAICKHLDRCLSNGEYILSALPLTKRYSNRVVIPKFLRGLYLLVFDPRGRLREDCDIQAIFFLRQILSFAKKTKLNCSRDAVINEVDEFVSLDKQLPEPSGFWDATSPDISTVEASFQPFAEVLPHISTDGEVAPDGASRFSRNLDIVSGLITSSLGIYDPLDWKFRHGPGAISETTKKKNKYSFSNWSLRLETTFPYADFAFSNFGNWAHSVNLTSHVSSMEPCSRLVDVPKTYTKPRLIAAEPSEHQWCQQNIWHYFRVRTENTWIKDFVQFSDQSLNQNLCVEGSRDGSLTTLDLSSASDRVQCDVVGRLFRRNPKLVLALQACRTRLLGQTLSKNCESLIKLRKFSTMGSACTFPVESLLFLCVVLSAVLAKRRIVPSTKSIQSLTGKVAIYGDDLVIPVDSRELVIWGLESLGLKVNTAKSFWTGLFRESCGVDAFAGVAVTPAYWRSPCDGSADSIASMVDVSNNFYKKFLIHTSSYLASTIQQVRIPVVTMESGVCGHKSFVRPRSDGPRRWNTCLQRHEVQVPVLSSTAKRTPITDDSALLQFFTELPQPHTMWRSGFTQRPKLRIKFRWVPTYDLGYTDVST